MLKRHQTLISTNIGKKSAEIYKDEKETPGT